MSVEEDIHACRLFAADLDVALKSAEKAAKLDKNLAAAVERLKGSAKK